MAFNPTSKWALGVQSSPPSYSVSYNHPQSVDSLKNDVRLGRSWIQDPTTFIKQAKKRRLIAGKIAKRLTKIFVILAFCSCAYSSSAANSGSNLKVDYIPTAVLKEYCTDFGNISSENYDVVEALHGAIEKAKGYPEASILAITNITKSGGKSIIEAKAVHCVGDYKLRYSAQVKAKSYESEKKKFVESQPVEVKCFIDGGIPIRHGSESECMFM